MVNRIVDEPDYSLVELDEDYQPEDSPAYVKLAEERTMSFEDFINQQRGIK